MVANKRSARVDLAAMRRTASERLRIYLAALPPQARALLRCEFERAVARGEDAAAAHLVLGELRELSGPAKVIAPVPLDEPMRRAFRPLEPFLTDAAAPLRAGQIGRHRLLALWKWLERAGAPGPAKALAAAIATSSPDDIDSATNELRLSAAAAIARIADLAPVERRIVLARISGSIDMAELTPIGTVLAAHEPLEMLNARLPGQIRSFADSHVAAVVAALEDPRLQAPLVMPFTIALVMQRIAAPWQIIRLAVSAAASDSAVRIAASPFGVAITMAIEDLTRVAGRLQDNFERGHYSVLDDLKTLHDGVRGLRTELHIRGDSLWGRQLAALRVQISGALRSEIDTIPGRVRRLLRQRLDRDLTRGAILDATEVASTAALIELLAACRLYAGELAINEVALRTWSEVTRYVGPATDLLVASLRTPDSRIRRFQEQQVDAAVRFCAILFSEDYAAVIRRAADNALANEDVMADAGRLADQARVAS